MTPEQIAAVKQALAWIEANADTKDEWDMVADLRHILTQDALDKKADNARELGLDYEPVACKKLCELCLKRGYSFCANAAKTTPLPQPAAWVGLTDAERKVIMQQQKDFWGVSGWEWKACEAIEAKLKEKNT